MVMSKSTYEWAKLDPKTGEPTDEKFSLPSVTTIIPSPDLLWYGYEIGLKGCLELEATANAQETLSGESQLLMGLSLPELKLSLKEAKLDPWSVGQQTTMKGSRVHGVFEKMAETGGEWFPELKEDDPEYGMLTALRNWWTDHKPVILEDDEGQIVERTVHSFVHGYAGTMDAIRISAEGPILIDLKTQGVEGKEVQGKPKKLTDYDSHHMQIAAYRHAWEEMGGQLTVGGEVILLGDDGTYDVKPQAPRAWEAFLAALNLYNSSKRLRANMRTKN